MSRSSDSSLGSGFGSIDSDIFGLGHQHQNPQIRVHICEPTTVFRAESKPPEIVLAAGMEGKDPGSHTSIFNHARGCDSTYVSTSRSLEISVSFIKGRPGGGCMWGDRDYIYLIKANPDNAFDARASIEASEDIYYHNHVGIDCREVAIQRVEPEDIIGYIICPKELKKFTYEYDLYVTRVDQIIAFMRPYVNYVLEHGVFRKNRKFIGPYPDNTPRWWYKKALR